MRSPIVRSPIAVLYLVLVAASLQAHRQARGSPNLRQRQRALHRRVVAGGWQGDLSNRVLALGKLTGWKRIIPPSPPPPPQAFFFFLCCCFFCWAHPHFPQTKTQDTPCPGKNRSKCLGELAMSGSARSELSWRQKTGHATRPSPDIHL